MAEVLWFFLFVKEGLEKIVDKVVKCYTRVDDVGRI